MMQYWENSPGERVHGTFARFCDLLWLLFQGKLPMPPQDDVIGISRAVVNQSRWILPCPFEGCLGALVAPAIPTIYCCAECGTGWYQIIFPADRSAIEKALLLRPEAHNRNWRPGETVEMLLAENAAHGVDA